ncbi:MAG: hypothetical protein ACLQLO_15570 [Mycobacterium sp.]
MLLELLDMVIDGCHVRVNSLERLGVLKRQHACLLAFGGVLASRPVAFRDVLAEDAVGCVDVIVGDCGDAVADRLAARGRLFRLATAPGGA